MNETPHHKRFERMLDYWQTQVEPVFQKLTDDHGFNRQEAFLLLIMVQIAHLNNILLGKRGDGDEWKN
jgi:hypothetical protein